jgi:hypothetical protein
MAAHLSMGAHGSVSRLGSHAFAPRRSGRKRPRDPRRNGVCDRNPRQGARRRWTVSRNAARGERRRGLPTDHGPRARREGVARRGLRSRRPRRRDARDERVLHRPHGSHVSEWTATRIAQPGERGRPPGSANVARGGGWPNFLPRLVSATYRWPLPPTTRLNCLGFRCVRPTGARP